MKYLYLDVRSLKGMGEKEFTDMVDEHLQAFPEFSKIVYGDVRVDDSTSELIAKLRYLQGYAVMAMPSVDGLDVSTQALLVTIAHSLARQDIQGELIIVSIDKSFEVLTGLCKMYGVKLTLIV